MPPFHAKFYYSPILSSPIMLIWFVSFALLRLTDKRTFAKEGINSSFLHVLIDFKSKTTFWYFVLSVSNDLMMLLISFPCFFLICLKISLMDYSLITNKHSQKLFNILEKQQIWGGVLKILIFCVSLSRTDLQSKIFNSIYKAKS